MDTTQKPARRPLLVSLLLTTDGSRLRAGWRMALHFLLMVINYLALSVSLSLVVFLLDYVIPGASLPSLVPEFVIGSLIAAAAVTAATFAARRRLDKRSIPSLGLAWDRAAAVDLLVGFLLGAVVMGGIFALLRALGWLQVAGFAWDAAPNGAWLGGFFSVLVLFILVGWYEELIFRGYWLQNLADGINLPVAVLLTSSIFAVGHLWNPNASWIISIGLFAAGLLFAFLYLRSGRLWLPVGLHIGWNFFQGSVFGFPVSGLTGFSLIRTTITGPELLTGGAFGPEAGLLVLPGMLFIAAVVWVWKARRGA